MRLARTTSPTSRRAPNAQEKRDRPEVYVPLYQRMFTISVDYAMGGNFEGNQATQDFSTQDTLVHNTLCNERRPKPITKVDIGLGIRNFQGNSKVGTNVVQLCVGFYFFFTNMGQTQVTKVQELNK